MYDNYFFTQETPFVMRKAMTNNTGNARYEGFCVDLIKSISDMVGFQYEIEISGDGVYGVIDTETGEWNGLVKGLIDKVLIFNFLCILAFCFFYYYCVINKILHENHDFTLSF